MIKLYLLTNCGGLFIYLFSEIWTDEQKPFNAKLSVLSGWEWHTLTPLPITTTLANHERVRAHV